MAKKEEKPVEVESPVETEVEKQAITKPTITIKEVTLGVSTVNDHERRITILEARIEELAK